MIRLRHTMVTAMARAFGCLWRGWTSLQSGRACIKMSKSSILTARKCCQASSGLDDSTRRGRGRGRGRMRMDPDSLHLFDHGLILLCWGRRKMEAQLNISKVSGMRPCCMDLLGRDYHLLKFWMAGPHLHWVGPTQLWIQKPLDIVIYIMLFDVLSVRLWEIGRGARMNNSTIRR